MSKKVNLRVLFTMMMVALLSFNIVSCSSDDDEKLDDGSSNTTDVAVTSNVSKLGVTYAHIDGYVNLNLITSSYTSQQVGIELAMTEDFVNAKQAIERVFAGITTCGAGYLAIIHAFTGFCFACIGGNAYAFRFRL